MNNNGRVGVQRDKKAPLRAKDLERIKACHNVYREKLAACRSAHLAYWSKESTMRGEIGAWQTLQRTYRDLVRAERRVRSARRIAQKRCTPGELREITQWETTWRNADRVRCYWCGRESAGKKCHADHIIPLSRNGAHCLENLVVCCSECNLRKSYKAPEQWRAAQPSVAQA